MATILIVDDDPGIVEVLQAYLRAEGHVVETAMDGTAAVPLLARANVAVLDWMLPGLTGVELTQYIRTAHPDLPVLLLTARGEIENRLEGLDAGADDYMVKPFSPREVVARVRALLRRVQIRERIVVGPLEVDVTSRQLTLNGEGVSFSRTEFDLLITLAQHPGMVWSRDRLLERVWGSNYLGTTRVVDVHITAIRRKLGDDADAPTFIETVRGLGYRFRES
ncbi:response regulator transcription factor [Deinococcus sp. QL22]|uniref:response regulator transcription factor n=1 Tax=Deinococcus sp. QL22 TaxID=2939437 RepID=UPI002017D76C|nr:response regulator transcription factor [Deinococcus sp. QL22]UQN08538.1 response regulator transcription factor [Deinococcus sp. QL22]